MDYSTLEIKDEITISLAKPEFEPWGLFQRQEEEDLERPQAFIWLTQVSPEVTLHRSLLSDFHLDQIFGSHRMGEINVVGIPILEKEEKMRKQREKLFRFQAVNSTQKEISDHEWSSGDELVSPTLASLDALSFLSSPVRKIKAQVPKLVKECGLDLFPFLEECLVKEKKEKNRKSILKLLKEAQKEIAGGIDILRSSNKEDLINRYSRMIKEQE